MAIETEKKYRIDEAIAERLVGRLAELEAEFSYEHFEENNLYRGGVLDGRDAVLRLRKTGTRSILTYKETIPNNSEFKERVEFETEVADADAAEQIIERLGFKLALVYEKRRRAWTLSGVEVVLDELPFGQFMEIEGEIEAIREVEQLLGAGDFDVERRGYPTLTLENGEIVNGVTETRFV